MDQKGQIWITKSLSEQQKACAQNSGLEVKEIALTKIQHLDFPKDLPAAEAWIFTSQNAVNNLSQNNFAGKVYASGKQTAKALKDAGIKVSIINKVMEGRPHIVDAILNKEIDMIINTTEGRQSIKDSFSIRRSALEHSIFFTTTISGGFAIVESLEKGVENWEYKPLQLS